MKLAYVMSVGIHLRMKASRLGEYRTSEKSTCWGRGVEFVCSVLTFGV